MKIIRSFKCLLSQTCEKYPCPLHHVGGRVKLTPLGTKPYLQENTGIQSTASDVRKDTYSVISNI